MENFSANKQINPRELAEILRNEDRFLIVSHRRPDGDCLGSATALLAGLRAMNKVVAAYNVSGVPRILRFLPLAEEVHDRLPEWTPSVTIFVDCGSADRVDVGFRGFGKIINIDHHATNDEFGDLNYIDLSATAVGEQVYHLLRALDVAISREMAMALYTSVAADTGNFRYQNTTRAAFLLAAELVELGAVPSYVCQNLYESKTPEEITLIGRCLSRLTYECGGRLVWSELRWSDYADVGGAHHEPEGLSSDIRGIDGVELSILFQETRDGALRASFRSKGLVDCTAIAEPLGGGGHPAASGYSSGAEVDFNAERERIVVAAKQVVGAHR